MYGKVGLAQRTECVTRSGNGVGKLGIVPHGATAGRPPDGVQAQRTDFFDVVARRRRFVAPEGETGRIPAVQSQKSIAPAPGSALLHGAQEGAVQPHVVAARPAHRIDDQLPAHEIMSPQQPAPTGMHPSADRCIPDCDPRRRHQPVQRTAKFCVAASPPRGTRPAPASRACSIRRR